jgi:hypothetical protein
MLSTPYILEVTVAQRQALDLRIARIVLEAVELSPNGRS